MSSNVQFEGGSIVLTHTGYGGAALYMNLPTTASKTRDYDKEMTQLLTKLIGQTGKMKSKNFVSMKTIKFKPAWIYDASHHCQGKASLATRLRTTKGFPQSHDRGQ